jgi:hypothetical protein
MAQFLVLTSYYGTVRFDHTFAVEAETAEEAREIALDRADNLPDDEWDESFVGADSDIESEIVE